MPYANNDFSTESIRDGVLAGRLHLLLITDGPEVVGASVIAYQKRAGKTVAHIHAMAGNGVTTGDNWVQLKTIFEKEGASHVEAVMRPSVARLWSRLGFKESHRVFEVEL
jgi:hypothetical protein